MPHYFLIPLIEPRLASNKTFGKTVVAIRNPCTNTARRL
jgi:hypothetical protein